MTLSHSRRSDVPHAIRLLIATAVAFSTFPLSLLVPPCTPIAPAPAVAAGITVNTLDDELNTDGDCSLREAITAANTNTAQDACGTGFGTDFITFSVSGAVTLASMLPDITDRGLVIDGAG